MIRRRRRRRRHLIYVAQCDTNGILTALYTVIKYNLQMNIHETIIFIHKHMST